MTARHVRQLILTGVICLMPSASPAQDGGTFMPHDGAVLTTVWTNAYGPDADSWIRFSKVGPDSLDINYSSSRGTAAVRRVRIADRMAARTIVLGYSAKMPLVIENTTSLGTSAAVLEDLRTTGQASAALVYNEGLATMDGNFKLAGSKLRMPVVIDSETINLPVIHATGAFRAGNKKAVGDFYFLDNRNNPLLIEYSIKFSGEKTPRTERIVRVTAGASERTKMEHALATLRSYDLYGIRFDFDKATIRRDTAPLLNDIAVTLKNNPVWTLNIVGHTDSIGKAGYNQKLSAQRAASVKAALVKRGIDPSRLAAAGAGPGQPKADNTTLTGRALNRRVELTRTDR